MSEQQMTNEAAKRLTAGMRFMISAQWIGLPGSFCPVMSANLSYMNSPGCLKNGA